MAKGIFYQTDEVIGRYGNRPDVAAQELERLDQCGAVNQEKGGCHRCLNSESAFEYRYCMLAEKYPGCVARGKYRNRGC